MATISRVDPRVSYSQFPVSLSIPRDGHDSSSTSAGLSDRLPFTDSRTVYREDGDSMLLRNNGNRVTGLISGGDIVVPRSRIFAYFFFYILKAIKSLVRYPRLFHRHFCFDRQKNSQAVPWIWQFVTGLLPRRPAFSSGPIYLQKVFHLLCWLSTVSIILDMTHAHPFIYYRHYIVLDIDGVFKWHTEENILVTTRISVRNKVPSISRFTHLLPLVKE